MLIQEKQNEYFNKRFQCLLKHLNAFSSSKDPADLHKFRLEIKKTNALISLLSAHSGNNKIKSHFKPVRRIFKFAGKIRDLQLNLAFIENRQLYDEAFYKEQKENMAIQTQQFCKNIKLYELVIQKAFEILIKHTKNISENFIISEINSQVKQITRFIIEFDYKDNPHKCRKLIKYILFISNLYKPVKQKMNHFIQYLDKLQVLIGEWHDIIDIIKWAQHPKSHISISEKKLLDEKEQKMVVMLKFLNRFSFHLYNSLYPK